ncbi:hypothetical protein OHD62_20400 [Mesorhizobium sp. YC-39]|uniref:hypothetical protein n=1 Tax=unclassified Mesorhizobium TaxID=325217 RepID=UPI0021E6E4D1|nr:MULTISPECIES: hypothetical protein [unclassified Mesorhizobium]MCV3210209.1 hypothetical protein [Mesorhizobium sp. YC-2]MCV3230739.1 hypothetical protein [Mesorhizobium sp. YC-39]
MVPGRRDFFGALTPARSVVGPLLGQARGDPVRRAAKPKIDTVSKEVYKKFVDICLTDFCYPRTHARL